MSDEAHMIQEIGHLRELRLTAEAVQADHDRHAQSEAIELTEEYISKREMELEHEVTDEVWSLYVHEGEEGIKRRHEERKLEAVRNRVDTDIPEWLRDHAAEGKQVRGVLQSALDADFPFHIEHRIGITEFLVDEYYYRYSKDFWLQEYARIA